MSSAFTQAPWVFVGGIAYHSGGRARTNDYMVYRHEDEEESVTLLPRLNDKEMIGKTIDKKQAMERLSEDTLGKVVYPTVPSIERIIKMAMDLTDDKLQGCDSFEGYTVGLASGWEHLIAGFDFTRELQCLTQLRDTDKSLHEAIQPGTLRELAKVIEERVKRSTSHYKWAVATSGTHSPSISVTWTHPGEGDTMRAYITWARNKKDWDDIFFLQDRERTDGM